MHSRAITIHVLKVDALLESDTILPEELEVDVFATSVEGKMLHSQRTAADLRGASNGLKIEKETSSDGHESRRRREGASRRRDAEIAPPCRPA